MTPIASTIQRRKRLALSLILASMRCHVQCFNSERYTDLLYRPHSLSTPHRLTKSTELHTTSNTVANIPGLVITENFIDLPTSYGIKMQVLHSSPPNPSVVEKPTLVFLHGSFHGAWCWTEKFFSYFVDKGHSVVAPSWRGTGGTFAGKDVTKVKISEHVDDLAYLLQVLPSLIPSTGTNKPILIAHSFGGMAIMKLLENKPELAASLGGICTLCSVPPSGNGKMTIRFLRRSLVASWKITAGFAMKECLRSSSICRELFFGGDKKVSIDGTYEDYGVSDDDVDRYREYFKRDSQATIDLFDLGKQLPSRLVNSQGRAPFSNNLPITLVIGAKDDYLVDIEALVETANYFNASEPLIVDSPHDVMLGRKWQNAADALDEWIYRCVAA
jgi:pimeloyl-ACP methyl ester carboxylesterase